jgi:MFS transporter, DHA2 family, multidrug resistance protein
VATATRLPAEFAIAPPEDKESAFPPWPQFLAFCCMAFGMFMAILDIQIVSASLAQIQSGLAASPDEAAWIQSSYLLAEVVMIPLSGFLSRALSTRNLYVMSCLGFTVSSLMCATATNIEQMIIYRALQGFLGGALIPTVYAASFLMFGRKRQVGVTVAVSLIVTLAPASGAALGGWITDLLGWRWLFLINVIPGILISAAVWALIDFDKPDYSLLKRIDYPGLLSMALFLVSLEYTLEEGAKKQWFEDPHIREWAATALVSGVGFFWWVTRITEPIVNLRAFLNRNFAAGCFLGSILGIGLYGLTYLYPLYLGRVARLSSAQIGSIVFVTGVVMMFSAPLAGILARKFDARVLAILGFVLMGLSSWLSQSITQDWRFDQFLVPQILRGAGLMFGIVSVSTTAFSTLPNTLVKDATSLFTFCRNLGGAIGLALLNTILLARTNFHWQALIPNVNLARPEIADMVDGLQANAENIGSAVPAEMALQELGQLTQLQASILAFEDCFFILTIGFACAAFIPLFLKTTNASPPPSGH